MSESQIHNVNVVAKVDMPTPAEVKAALPLDAATEKSVLQSRQALHDILDGREQQMVKHGQHHRMVR